MAEYSVEAFVRKDLGKSYRNNLYGRGLIPGVVYGKALGSLPLEVREKDVYNAVQSGRNNIINLSVAGNGGPYKVMVKDLQFDQIKKALKHVDFQQISLEQSINASIPVNLAGEPNLGLPRILLRKLDISCLPADIPGYVTVDVSGMKPGDVIKAGEIQVPKGIKVNTEADEAVVTIVAPEEERTESVVEETGEQAEENSRAEENTNYNLKENH